jgi:hypothetical protein
MAISKIPSAGFQDNVKFRNIIINGDMSIAQRGTSTASITGGGYYTVDRFNLGITTLGTWTQSQDTDVPTGQGFAKSLKMDCTTADGSPGANDVLQINYKMEGQQLQYLKKGTSSAESTTLSFWIKATKTGTNIVELFDLDNSRQISKSYTVSSSDTWEKKTITFDGDTSGAFGNDNAASLQLDFFFGAGSNYTSGTLNTSWNSNTTANRAVGQVNHADSTSNNIYITGVQLEAGQISSEFEFLPVDVNLHRCQRYYFNSEYNTSSTLGYGYHVAGNATRIYMSVHWKNTMRAAPTLASTFDIGAGTTQTADIYQGQVWDDSGSANGTGILQSITASAEL